jgi:hypothetical protein
MSLKHLLHSQSNLRSGLRAELTDCKIVPNWYDNRRNKKRKYYLPEDWQKSFKNRCFFCNQYVNGVKGMKGHIRSCKEYDISNNELINNDFIMYYDADNDFEVNDDIRIDDRINQNDQIVQK